jgi:RNA-directed DNA polymerase
MTKAPISLQDLRRSLYVKAKAEPLWRFWGLYVHVCKMETLREAYQMARSNGGAPGIDGVTFEAIEESGAESFLGQIQEELVTNTYRPMRARKKEIPKDGGKKVRVLSIPAIRNRVVQGALKLILEPIFEADFRSRVVWISTEADGARSRSPSSPSDRRREDAHHRFGSNCLFR